MRRLLLLSALLLVPAAWAKSPRKMSDSELLTEFKSGDKAGKRADAAAEIGARRLMSAAADLGAACGGDPDPSVCTAAIDALVAFNASDGWDQIQAIFERDAAAPEARIRAGAILLEKSPGHFDDAAPRMLSVYRGLEPALGEDLFQGIAERGLSELADGVMFAALDGRAERSPRLAALTAAEGFEHPRLYEAYVLFLKDHDRDLRVRSAEGLNDPELPGSVVVPALIAAANDDPEGSVRAAALVSLRQYAHTELLAQVLHTRIVEDTHPYAWESAFELLVVLADESSLKPLYKVIDEREYLKETYLDRIVDLIGSMDKPESMVPIMALEQRHQGTALAEHCREVLSKIESETEAVERPRPEIDFNVWVPGSPDPHIPSLTVDMGSDDVLSGI